MLLRHILCTLIFFTSVQALWAQHPIVITEHFNNQSLKYAFQILSREYDQLINYDDQLVSSIFVNVELDQVGPDEAIDRLLQGTNLQYEKDGEVFIVRPSLIPVPKITIRGIVKDKNLRTPLPFATVQSQKNANLGVNADSLGKFSFTFPLIEGDTLIVSHVRYFKRKLPVTSHLEQRFQTIFLQISEDLPAIEIAGNHHGPQTLRIPDAAGKIEINPSKAQFLSGLGEPDIFRAIQLLPGVTFSGESASRLHIRGGSTSQNLILLDGITIYQPDHFFGLVSTINNHAIKDVNLYRGGFDARYGGRTAGVIQIEGRPEGCEEESYGSSANILNLNGYLEVPLAKGKASLMLAGRSSYSSPDQIEVWPYQQLIRQQLQEGDYHVQTQNGKRINPLYKFQDANAKLVWVPASEDLFSISLYHGSDRLSYNYSDFDDPATKDTRYDLRLVSRGVSAGWNRQWNKHWYSRTTLAYSGYQSNYEFDWDFTSTSTQRNRNVRQNNSIQDITLRNQHEWDIRDNDKLEAGVFLTNLSVNNDYRLRGSDSLFYQTITANPSANILGGFGQYNYRPSNLFLIKGGLRYSYFSPTDKHYWEPRLSAEYKPTGRWTVKATVGQYFQFLNQIAFVNDLGQGEDFWALSGVDSLPVSAAKHAILGASYQVRKWTFDIEFYHQRHSGLISFGQEYDFVNSRYLADSTDRLIDGRGKSTGLDLLLKYEGKIYTGWVAYSISNVSYRFSDILDDTWFSADQDRLHNFKFVNIFQHKRWQWTASWIVMSGSPYTQILNIQQIPNQDFFAIDENDLGPRNGARLSAYHRLDASLAFNVIHRDDWKGQLGVSAFNLYNRMNQRDVIPFPNEDQPQKSFSPPEKPRTLLGITPNVFVNLEF